MSAETLATKTSKRSRTPVPSAPPLVQSNGSRTTPTCLIPSALPPRANELQSNHSNVDSAIREVERRARTAGGRVWALIRGQSRQHSSDDDDDDDEGDGDNDGTDGGGSPGAGGGGAGEATASTRTAGGGGGGLFPSEHDGDGGGDAAAPEWVLSRLELTRMRRRGSFLDGDQVGPVRTAAGAAEAASVSAATGEANTADSFEHLARLASVDGDGDRRDTDEAVSALRDAMVQHSAALSRLAGWMVHVAPPPPPPADGSEGGLMAAAPMESHPATAGVEEHGDFPSPPCPGLSGDSSFDVAGSSSEEEGVRAMLDLSRESDVLEGRVKRERFKAHRAADEEIHRTPEIYRQACALGNALILKGHDYLSQVCRGDLPFGFGVVSGISRAVLRRPTDMESRKRVCRLLASLGTNSLFYAMCLRMA